MHQYLTLAGGGVQSLSAFLFKVCDAKKYKNY